MPKFAVVIPTYNRAKSLQNTLFSVLNQTHSDFEVIVVDDGSSDDTAAVVANFNDSRLKYFFIENSGGPATPRNIGIKAASSEWICFLDSDDLWYPDKLATLADSIEENTNVDAICNDEIVFDPIRKETKVLRYGPVTSDFYRTLLVEGNRCSTSAMTIRKSFIDEFQLTFNTAPDFVIVEDYDFWMRLAFYGARFRFLNTVLGEYVLGVGNISANVEKSRNNWLRVLKEHAFHLQKFEPDCEKLWRELQARACASNAASDLRLYRPLSFARNIIKAIFLSPSELIKWFYSRLSRRLT